MREITIPAPLSRKWTDRFALDLAMSLEKSGDSMEEILEAHKLTEEELLEFTADPLFNQLVNNYRSALQEQGITFKFKAKVQAPMLLDNSWDLIHTHDVSPAVKADLIKWTAKMAGFEPDKGAGSGADGGVKINIYMGDAADAPPPGIRTIENG